MKNEEPIQFGNSKDMCSEKLYFNSELYTKSLKQIEEEVFDFYKQSFGVKSGFPHYRRGGWLQLFRMRPFGWEDRGKCNRRINNGLTYYKICFECYTELHVGRENNQSFKFCPKCLTKIKE